MASVTTLPCFQPEGVVLKIKSLALAAAVALLAAHGTASAVTLLANPTANNGGSAGWGVFFNLQAAAGQVVTITDLATASNAAAGGAFSIEVFTRSGTALGVALLFTDAGPRYFGTGAAPLQTFSDANLSLVAGDVRSAPFTPGGGFFSSRALTGSLTYSVSPVPEPATWAFMAFGLAGLMAWRRRRSS